MVSVSWEIWDKAKRSERNCTDSSLIDKRLKDRCSSPDHTWNSEKRGKVARGKWKHKTAYIPGHSFLLTMLRAKSSRILLQHLKEPWGHPIPYSTSLVCISVPYFLQENYSRDNYFFKKRSDCWKSIKNFWERWVYFPLPTAEVGAHDKVEFNNRK